MESRSIEYRFGCIYMYINVFTSISKAVSIECCALWSLGL